VAFLLTQAISSVIPLKELQKMRTLRPVSDGGLPGIELNYGSAASPKTMWLELSQVRSAWTHSFLLAVQKLPVAAERQCYRSLLSQRGMGALCLPAPKCSFVPAPT